MSTDGPLEADQVGIDRPSGEQERSARTAGPIIAMQAVIPIMRAVGAVPG